MTSATEQHLASLETITEDLFYMSETDEVIRPMAWSHQERGDCNITQVLLTLGLIRPITLDNLLERWQGSPDNMSSKQTASQIDFSPLLQTFQTHLRELQAYEFKNYKESPGSYDAGDGFDGHDCFQFLVGQTAEQDWLGITPCFRKAHTCHYGDRALLPEHIPSSAAQTLATYLKPQLESFRPEIVRYECNRSPGLNLATAASADQLVEQILVSARMLEVWKFSGFGREDDELENLEQFFLRITEEPRLYVLGNWAIFRFYILGQLASKDWLGIATAATWT